MTTPAARRPVPDRALPWVGTLAVVAVFELLSRTELIASRFFPPITTWAWRLLEEATASAFWTSVGRTLQGWAFGLGIACAIAVPAGIVIGSTPLLHRATRAVTEFLRPIPSVALIPLAILVYGNGLESKVFLAAFASLWPLLMQTLYGVQDVDPVATDTARSFGFGRGQRLLRVTLPSAVPYIATGVRIASSVALILVVTAELVIGSPGLGREINLARQGTDVDLMYALILATGMVGFVLNLAFGQVERRFLHWHPSHRVAVR